MSFRILLLCGALLGGCWTNARGDAAPQDYDVAGVFDPPRQPPQIPKPEEIEEIKKAKVEDLEATAWNFRNIAEFDIREAKHAGRRRDACIARNRYHRELQRICDESREMGLDVDCGEIPVKDCSELPNQTVSTPELRTAEQ